MEARGLPGAARDSRPCRGSYTRLMPRGFIARSLARAVGNVPGLRRVPVLKLLAAAEIALLAHDHVMRLDREERRRLFELIRIGRGRRRNLSDAEQRGARDADRADRTAAARRPCRGEALAATASQALGAWSPQTALALAGRRQRRGTTLVGRRWWGDAGGGAAGPDGVSKIRHFRLHKGTNRARLLDLGYISTWGMLM